MMRRLAGVFTHDLKNKAIALFFALTVWYFAWNNQIRVSEVSKVMLHVQVENTGFRGMEWRLVRVGAVRGGEAESGERNAIAVHLAVTGPHRDLRELSWSAIKGSLNVRPDDCYEFEGYYHGEARLTGKEFNLPTHSLRVVENSLAPNMVFFQLSPVETEALPVQAPRIVDRPPPPYRLSATREPIVEPAQFRVRGAKYYLPRCEIVTGTLSLEGIDARDLVYEQTVSARLVMRDGGDRLDMPFLVDDAGGLLASDDVPVKVTIFFEQESTQKKMYNVRLWAKVPLTDPPVAVRYINYRASMDVVFKGTAREMEMVEANRSRPEFGLYFIVDPARRPGGPWPVSLTNLRRDPDLIPPGVTLELPEPTGVGAPVDSQIMYELVPLEQ